jgi:hypothetical protein
VLRAESFVPERESTMLDLDDEKGNCCACDVRRVLGNFGSVSISKRVLYRPETTSLLLPEGLSLCDGCVRREVRRIEGRTVRVSAVGLPSACRQTD